MKLIILSLIFILLYFNVYANEKNSSIRNKNLQIQTIIYKTHVLTQESIFGEV